MEDVMRNRVALAAIVIVASGLLGRAQDERPVFETASVKRNTSDTIQATTQVLPNGVNLINLPLRTIIRLAYNISQPTLVVGPG